MWSLLHWLIAELFIKKGNRVGLDMRSYATFLIICILLWMYTFSITFDTYWHNPDVRAIWREYIWIANMANGKEFKGSELP